MVFSRGGRTAFGQRDLPDVFQRAPPMTQLPHKSLVSARKEAWVDAAREIAMSDQKRPSTATALHTPGPDLPEQLRRGTTFLGYNMDPLAREATAGLVREVLRLNSEIERQAHHISVLSADMNKMDDENIRLRGNGIEAIAAWMTTRGYATGHGDTIEDLLAEIEVQSR